jgi:DNA gyrase inhibitor GyrI
MRGSPQRKLSSIAAEVGFATPSDFSRVFRTTYGRTPSSWDRTSRLDGNINGSSDLVGDIDRGGNQTLAGPELSATVVERSSCRVVYVRVRHPWRGRQLGNGYHSLTRWLGRQGIDWHNQELIGVSWESELATPLDKLVYDLGVTVSPEVSADGEFGVHKFPAVRAVEVHCQTLPATAVAWDFLYRSWLPSSPYEPGDMPAMKRFRVMPERFDASAWNVDCSIALRPRRP